MSTLVIGGTGTVGSEVVGQLVQRGADVRVLTRSSDKADDLPEGADVAIGDLANPDSLVAALDGVESVFMITPLDPDETQLGLNGVRAMREAAVDRVVYMSVHNLEEGAHIPHFASKIPIVKEIESSGIAYTIIEPNNFFQNDLWYQQPIAEMGIYPQPIGGIGCSRVDVRDIAEAVVNALTQPGHEGKAYPLVGRTVLTGEDVAGVWTQTLDREVQYAGDDLDAWAEAASQMMPDWLVDDLRIMYQHFQDKGLVATADQVASTQDILGRAPHDFESFAAEVAPAWRS